MVSTGEKETTQESITMKALLEAGVHFGHPTQRWHPRMNQYIFAQRNGIHIIDLQQSMVLLERAASFVTDLVASGETVLFVGTKRQAQDPIEQAAKKCEMSYVRNRWLGGMLTNFHIIQRRIAHLLRLEDEKDSGTLAVLTKKEGLKKEEELERLNRNFGGVKKMDRVPGALFIVDIGQEKIAVEEGRKMNIPIVALVDTDCDPDLVDYPIAANDDAIRSINLVANHISNAVLEGMTRRERQISSIDSETQENNTDIIDTISNPETEIESAVEDNIPDSPSGLEV